jgi:hypothetical protein
MPFPITRTWEVLMTLESHYAAAREIWIICEATRRLWHITGDVLGPFKPEGTALAEFQWLRKKLQKRFLKDFPGQHDPYRDIEC